MSDASFGLFPGFDCPLRHQKDRATEEQHLLRPHWTREIGIRDVMDKIVEAAVGGTFIEAWSMPSSLASCGAAAPAS